ncbi:protein FAM53B isoform X2 [Polypterus senegalus]|uniref:protein FAM53B isoform X2 n=1 Tax=Polypterus senegalus TaxID=55291 RepID=UPI0019632842|nr:protein FAM53B isoform X2 [Polypterus senegalus]
MVIFLPAQLEKTMRVNHVAQRVPDSELLIPKKMSKGTTLFSCGLMESEAWGELSRRCPFQSEPPGASLDSLWDAMPVTCQEGSAWSRETGPCSLSSLIQDLSLSDAKGSQTTAPPSKRQCRSLSLSEELNSCRTIWRPIGSRIWTPVEKRRCHSGGSVQRCSNGFSGITMQRSSSFSLPARSNTFPGTFPRVCDQVCIPQDFGSQTFHGFQESSTITGSGAEREEVEPLRSLSLSHEQISTSDYQSPSARSTPDSTPELERRVRSGGLSRSRSQPCVLNDKKIGMKRRRPEEVLEQRPSLDLAKMTQFTGNNSVHSSIFLVRDIEDWSLNHHHYCFSSQVSQLLLKYFS